MTFNSIFWEIDEASHSTSNQSTAYLSFRFQERKIWISINIFGNFQSKASNEKNMKESIVPAGRFQLLPKLLEFFISHVFKREHIHWTVFFSSLLYCIYYCFFMFPSLFLCLRESDCIFTNKQTNLLRHHQSEYTPVNCLILKFP